MVVVFTICLINALLVWKSWKKVYINDMSWRRLEKVMMSETYQLHTVKKYGKTKIIPWVILLYLLIISYFCTVFSYRIVWFSSRISFAFTLTKIGLKKFFYCCKAYISVQWNYIIRFDASHHVCQTEQAFRDLLWTYPNIDNFEA